MLRELVVGAGLELLDERGLNLTYDSISYAKVFDYLQREYSIRVTRGSVHERIWASQQDFRRDVLAESVGFFPPSEMSRALLARAMASGDPAQFSRDLGSRTYPKVLKSQTFGQFQSVKALSSRFEDRADSDVIHRLLNDRSVDSMADCRAIFATLMAVLDLRPKVDNGLSLVQASDIFIVLITGLIDGGHLNHHAGAADIGKAVGFRSRRSDSVDPWRILSIGVISILEFLFEAEGRVAISPEVPPGAPQRRPNVTGRGAPAGSPALRRTREELRTLVLTAGVELLLKEGLGLREELLGYATVFAYIKERDGVTISRASVHNRLWDSNDDYRLEVLARSVGADSKPAAVSSDVLRSLEVVSSVGGGVDRHRTKNEFIRMGAAALAGAADSISLRRVIQIKASLIEDDGSVNRLRLRRAIQQAEERSIRRNKASIQESILDLGFAVRPETGLTEEQALEVLVALAMTVSAGLSMNSLAGVTAATAAVALPSADGDEMPRDWTPAGIAIRSFFDQFYQ